uniref:Basic phospholipase A2 (Fragments) n=1 Tax=Agkistrodon piscivorus leucostoma TaxID=459671 RepID=PA2B1_AGKPL|nr:RecName: Full=Basic phospholipase A2; Short=svPLA2 [Agkistrodon piscivorus leucostoma]
NLFQFEKLIKKSGMLWYSAYGCYCGWGGQGRPKDATDRCCFVHDCCYGKVTGCNPKCGGTNPCKKQICECDRAAAICFRDNLKTYDSKTYWKYPK